MRLSVGFYLLLGSLATLSLLLPLGVAGRRLGRLSEGQATFVVYLVLELLVSVTSFVMGRLGIHNLWLAYVVVPVQTALILRAFAAWQVDQRLQLALRRGAPLMLLFWLPPLFGWEPLQDFSIAVDSVQAILCVAIAAYTLVRRFLEADGPSADYDWFWISAGVMLYFATYALISPLSNYLMKYSAQTALAVFTVRGGMQVLANLLYYFGMRCPRSRQNFGPSISPPPSWSSSSWWPSGRR
jgi:hypothetical protein